MTFCSSCLTALCLANAMMDENVWSVSLGLNEFMACVRVSELLWRVWNYWNFAPFFLVLVLWESFRASFPVTFAFNNFVDIEVGNNSKAVRHLLTDSVRVGKACTLISGQGVNVVGLIGFSGQNGFTKICYSTRRKGSKFPPWRDKKADVWALALRWLKTSTSLSSRWKTDACLILIFFFHFATDTAPKFLQKLTFQNDFTLLWL